MHSRGGTGRIRKGSSEESLERIGKTGKSESWARGLNSPVAAEYRIKYWLAQSALCVEQLT